MPVQLQPRLAGTRTAIPADCCEPEDGCCESGCCDTGGCCAA